MDDAAGGPISGRCVARSGIVALILVAVSGAVLPAQSPVEMPPIAPLPQTLPGTVFPIPEPPTAVWWTVSLPAGAKGPPIVAGDHVYVARLPGTVVAYRIGDGSEAWTTDVAAVQPLAVDGELVIAASGEHLNALRARDGTTAWKVPLGSLTAPLLAKDGWVIAASATRLTAIRASDGGVIWSEDTAPVRERAAIMGDTLFVPVANGTMEARDLTTGAVKWRRLLGAVPQEPLAIGDRLFFGASNGYLYALDVDSSEEHWKWPVRTSIRGAPATDGERVYFVALDHLVRALDYRTGSLKWSTGLQFRPFTGPALVGTTLVISGAVPDVQLLRASDGQPVAAVPFQQDLAVPPAVGTVKGANLMAVVTGSLEESWRLTLVMVRR